MVQAFLKLTRELEIPDHYVQTSQLFVHPEYDWIPDTNQQRLSGYFVERQLTVDLRELDKLGSLMERAVLMGVNVISGPTLSALSRLCLQVRSKRPVQLQVSSQFV